MNIGFFNPSAPSETGHAGHNLSHEVTVRPIRQNTVKVKKELGDKNTQDLLSPQVIRWLASLMLLSQLPHYFQLPWWVSICGFTIVAVYFAACQTQSNKWRDFISTSHLLTIVALTAAVGVRLHYGYFLGRDPCVSFLFLVTACKFAETRKSHDAILLVCLSGFLLLTQYFYSQTILAAIVSLPAVIALGGSLYILQSSKKNIKARQVVKLISKLLLQGAPIAAVLFLLFPRLPGPLWSLPDDALAQTGLSDSMTPGAISELSQSAAVAFRVEFDGIPPRPDQLYWRGPVLSDFDGKTWSTRQRMSVKTPAGVPSDTDSTATKSRTVGYNVTVQPNNQNWLFALDTPVTLPRAVGPDNSMGKPLARMTNNHQLITLKPLTQAIRYRQYSTLESSYPDTHRPLLADTLLDSRGRNSNNRRNTKTIEFAQELRRKSYSDQHFAEQVMRWFREKPFYYTLKPSLLGNNPVDEFLFESRRGFCEHYSSAFTFMMRANGIPSRVVTGYLGGEMNGDYMIVRQSDAHAWTEVWLDGKWRRFDPTAAVAPSRVEGGLAASLPSDEPVPDLARGSSHGWLQRMNLRWDSVNHDWQRLVIDFDTDARNSMLKSSGLPVPTALQLTMIVLTVFAIWCLIILASQFNRRNQASPEEQLWQNFCQKFAKAGLPIGSSEGPLNFSQRIATEWPQRGAALEHLSKNLIDLRFAELSDSKRKHLLTVSRRQIRTLKLDT